MPHGSLNFLNIPESVYVHTHLFGDCGSQSMYFAALCRSIGIPTRAVGGYQLFPGMEGTHFWAEFYLPNYGWVPADTSVAQIYQYLPELTEAQKKAWKDYYFASMDPYRMVIQKDVDYPFAPPAPEPTVLSTVLQLPAVLCDTMDGVPEDKVWENYQVQFTKEP
jgi:transglutaminase-like putative cysteine protease